MAGVLSMTEGTAPSTPAAGTHDLYVDTAAAWHILSDAAADKTLATIEDQLTIADGAITNAKLANMAESRIKGRAAAAGTGAPVDLTPAEVATIIGDSLALPEGDAAWTAATLEASYATYEDYGSQWPIKYTPITQTTAFAPPGYRKVAGVVHLRGTARCTTAASTLMFTLPEGYRPEYQTVFPIYKWYSGTPASSVLTVYVNGEVYTEGNDEYNYHIGAVHFAPAGA